MCVYVCMHACRYACRDRMTVQEEKARQTEMCNLALKGGAHKALLDLVKPRKLAELRKKVGTAVSKSNARSWGRVGEEGRPQRSAPLAFARNCTEMVK